VRAGPASRVGRCERALSCLPPPRTCRASVAALVQASRLRTTAAPRPPKHAHAHPPPFHPHIYDTINAQGKRLQSFRTRTLSTFAMIALFAAFIYMGHVPMVLLVFTLQVGGGRLDGF
jgi:hypothetical protein